MAYYDLVWYCNAGNQSTTGYYAVALRPQNAAVTAGQLVRQFTAPAVGSERVFVCIIAGTTANTTDATWVLTRGAKTTDGTATWMECTGQAGLNGDLTNTATWAQVKAVTPAALGQIIKRSNNASYQICTTAGAMSASEPAMSDTAGVTTTDTTVVWTSLGPVGNFTSGQAPFARLATVFSLSAVAGNTVYVGDNHAESQATAITIAPAASQTTVGKIICHNHSGSYPPTAANLATTATISTTGSAAVTFQPAASGIVYIYGLTFVAGVGQSTAANVVLSISTGFSFFDACVFKLATTASSALISLNTNIGNASIMTWNNCQVSFSTASQYINPYETDFVWQNTAPVLATGSTVTTNLFGQFSTNFKSNILLEGLDLSSWTSVFLPTGANLSLGNWIVKDCKLNASATFPNPANTGQVIQTVRADGGATAYKSARYTLEGTETTETSITRVGGAADPTGQAQSRKIVTTANSQWLRPFKAEPYAMWNPRTAANVTVTVCGTINSGTLPNNDDIWMDVEYLGSSATPLGTIVNTTKANLYAANAVVASDGSTWNGGGSGAGWSPFKLTTTLSSPHPSLAGYLHVRPRVAKPSSTFYLDPQITLGIAGDPYFSSVKLLLGFEGANGSTAGPGMTDESSAASGTGTVTGSVTIDTSQFKFGASSLHCNFGGGITFPSSPNFGLGVLPFTVEAWVNPAALSGPTCFIALFGSSGPNLGWTLYQNGSVLTFNGSPDGTTNTVIMSGGTLTTGAWQHVCADFDGTKYRLYLNGVMMGSSTTLVNIFTPSKVLAIGANSDNALIYQGWIDEVRLTKGVARYASDSGYTVAVSAFPRGP